MRAALVLSLLMSGAAFAAPPRPAPKPVDKRPEIEKLFSQLAKAESAEEAHPIEARIEARFRVSGSPSVDLLMTRAEAAAAASDKKTAKKLVEAITNIAPNYAEGWHTRAAMEQADGDDTDALVSLQKTVLLNPRHFAAMVELADMLEDYGDKGGALKLYRRALDLTGEADGPARQIVFRHEPGVPGSNPRSRLGLAVRGATRPGRAARRQSSPGTPGGSPRTARPCSCGSRGRGRCGRARGRGRA